MGTREGLALTEGLLPSAGSRARERGHRTRPPVAATVPGMPRVWKQQNPDDQPAGTCPKCGNPWYGGDPDPGEKCPQCGHPLEGGSDREKEPKKG